MTALGVGAVSVLALMLLRSAGIGRLRATATSRLVLLRAALQAVAGLVLLRALLPWGETPAWTWWPPALLVVVGLAAAVARTPALPALDPARPRGRQIAAAAAEGVVATAVLGALLL